MTTSAFNHVVTPPSSRPASPISLTNGPSPIERSKLIVRPGNSVLLPVHRLPKYLDNILIAMGLHTEARTSFIT